MKNDLEYYISSIHNEKYCNSNDNSMIVYVHCKSNPEVKLELDIKGIEKENEVYNIVWEFNNPLRLEKTYFCKDIVECDGIFSMEISKYGFKAVVKSVNKKYLSDFIYFINNPEKVSMDCLIEEHNRLSRLIEAHSNSLRKLSKERRFLEYRMWTHNNEKIE